MEEKEFNKRILQELVRIAKEVFSLLEIGEGTYTAADLAKREGHDGKKLSYECPNTEYEICVDTFKCSFSAEEVFVLLWRFEALTNIPAKDKIRFIRTRELEKNVTCSFEFALTKKMKQLAKVAMDTTFGINPEYDYVWLDAKCGYMVAIHGGYAARANKVELSDMSGEAEWILLINKEDFKLLIPGLCKARMTENEFTITDMAGNTAHGKRTDERRTKVAFWKSAIPRTNGENRIEIIDVKSTHRLFKSLKGKRISLSGKKDETKVHIDHEKGMMEFDCHPLPFDFKFGISTNTFLSTCLKWDGTIFATSNRDVLLFGDLDAELAEIMPCECEFEPYDAMKVEFTDTFGANWTPYLEYVEKVKQAGQTEQMNQRKKRRPTSHKANERNAKDHIAMSVEVIKEVTVVSSKSTKKTRLESQSRNTPPRKQFLTNMQILYQTGILPRYSMCHGGAVHSSKGKKIVHDIGIYRRMDFLVCISTRGSPSIPP